MHLGRDRWLTCEPFGNAGIVYLYCVSSRCRSPENCICFFLFCKDYFRVMACLSLFVRLCVSLSASVGRSTVPFRVCVATVWRFHNRGPLNSGGTWQLTRCTT